MSKSFGNQKGRLMKRKHSFVTIDSTPIRDPRLSYKATGIMMYFVDKPEDWEFRLSHIIDSKTDGEKSVRSGINELKKAGYIVRVAFRKGGKVDHYEFFVYERPVQYPTEKDVHIDIDDWNQYLEEHQDDDLIDVTVAVREIKEQKKQAKQVSQNRKPEKNRGFEQVSHFGKPEDLQGFEQVSQNQHPAFQQAVFQDAEKEVLSNTYSLVNNKSLKNYDDDQEYRTLRFLFIAAQGKDIVQHEVHYPRFREALGTIGSFNRMIELANRYILRVQVGKHAHDVPQIAWFLKDGWRNFVETKIANMSNRKLKRGYIPESIRRSMEEQSTTIDTRENEQRPYVNDELQKKLDLWESKKQGRK